MEPQRMIHEVRKPIIQEVFICKYKVKVHLSDPILSYFELID